MNIDIPELRAFLAVANSGSFTRAATALNLSQPALSRRIRLLESTLGGPLFSRLMDGVRLTSAGEALLPHARVAVAAVQDGTDAVRSAHQGESGNIDIAVATPLFNAKLITVLREFRHLFPGVRISLRSGSGEQVSTMVLQGDVGLGLRYRVDPDRRLRCDPVWNERIVIIAAPEHPLATSRVVTPAQLARESWIARPVRPSEPDGGLSSTLVQYGLTAGHVTLIEGVHAQKRLVEANFGVALIARGSVQEELSSGSLVALNVPAARSLVPVVCLHRRSVEFGPSTKRLLEMFRESLGTTADPRSRRQR